MLLDPNKTGPFVVGFNGPPRAGKDSIASCLQELLDSATQVPVHRQALAATMRDGAMAILGLSGGDKFYSDIKDKPLELLNGKTFRRFMIDMSEVFVKNVYGQDFWARLLYARNQSWWHGVPSILLVTDIGFPAEVEFLCEHSAHMINVRVDRSGCDFSTDSRGYCSAQVYGGQDVALSNDGTLQEAAEHILKVMYKSGWPVL